MARRIVARVKSPKIILQAPVADALAWLSFEFPVEILQASTLDEVRPTLRAAEAAAATGRMAAGFVSYEAAPAFDPALKVQTPSSLPLAWFGVFDTAETLDRLSGSATNTPRTTWLPSIDSTEYEEGIDVIHRHIARGDVYQVNFTLRLTSSFPANPWDLFIALCRGQRSRCCAFVDTGDRVLCSASPELFFRLEGERIWSRPMKGTAPRGRTREEDARQAHWLQTSTKNQAENLMIVDMLRNDLGRIAIPDTVEVSELWHLEKYPSLFQLTSTVEGRTQASMENIFAALFPCASVTGAPKVRSMEIIRELEQEPRGAYTGAIGLIGPGRRARFNVAIRTVDVDTVAERASYGTGSGVVWDSVAPEEWGECLTKALVLRSPTPEFDLLETILWDPAQGFVLLERHLLRLEDSAAYFDYPYDAPRIVKALDRAIRELPRQPHRIRLLVSNQGIIRVESAPLDRNTRPWRLAVAAGPVAREDPFLCHKTTHRQVYQAHRERFPEHDDVLLWNDQGEITESTLANVVVLRQQRWVTPPVDCGLLAGTFRAELLDQGKIEEETLGLRELRAAERICLINSVRQWIDTELDATSLAAATETRPSEIA